MNNGTRNTVTYSDHLELMVIRALSPGDGPLDWESAIETVLVEWGKETKHTRDDAVDVVEHIIVKYPSMTAVYVCASCDDPNRV